MWLKMAMRRNPVHSGAVVSHRRRMGETFKVVLLGEGCVGKTSLVLRYCRNTFVDKHVQTIQVGVASMGGARGLPLPLARGMCMGAWRLGGRPRPLRRGRAI